MRVRHTSTATSGAAWRWKVAGQLNRLRRVCWVDLVTWCLHWSPKDDTLRMVFERGSDRCSSGAEFDRCGSCYCGKFRRPDVDHQFVGKGFRP